MKHDSVAEVRVKDPLRKITRKERKYLLLVSVVGLTVSEMGLVPEQISMFGITFSETNQSSFLLLIAFVVIYFVLAFIIYAVSDFIAWRLEFNKTRLEGLRKKAVDEEQEEYDKNYDTYNRLYRLVYFSRPASIFRGLFEFILPIVIGSYAIYSLLSAYFEFSTKFPSA